MKPNNNKNNNKSVYLVTAITALFVTSSTYAASSFIANDPYITGVVFVVMAVVLSYLSYTLLRFRRYQKKISNTEERLRLSLWASGDEMWDWHIDEGKLFRTNSSGVYALPSMAPGAFPPNQNIIHPADLPRVSEQLLKHLNGDLDSFECSYRLQGKNNDWTWILDKGKVVSWDNNGNAIRMTGTFKNIQPLKQTENELKVFAQSIESISEGVVIFDDNLNIVHVNPGYEAISGRSSKALIGTKLKFSDANTSLVHEIKEQVDATGGWHGDITGQRANGNMYLAYLTANCIQDEDGNISNYVAIVSDTTTRRQAEAKLIKMARTDGLTGLPNRNVFFSSLQKAVTDKVPTAVLVFDIDDFKKINDSLGHQIGDELLKVIGSRIKQLVDERTQLFRLGGDEFALVLSDTNDIHRVTLTAKNVLELLNKAFTVNQHEFVVTGSIGIVLSPDDGLKPEVLLRNADTAMYHAKEEGNRYLFFNEEMNKKAVKRLQVENLIRLGLKDDYFQVYYQPKVDLVSGKLVGMEALVRFITPKKGLISPGVFIPIAEETGQIIEIGDVVLAKACADMKRWTDAGLLSGRVAVNLSARQFTLPDLTFRIDDILEQTGLNPKYLELEITEGTVMDNPKSAIKVMHQLRDHGIHLALDDFGTGYSSLSYLSKFPLNTLKIDKAFVDDADTKVGKSMIDTIITIAKNLGLTTVAEGVEHSEQQEFMKNMECDLLQGFFYSKPLSAGEFESFVKANG